MKILAVDYGLARTGIAVSDPLGMIATPVVSLPSWDAEKLLASVVREVKERGAEKIVVGRPLRTDGKESDMASRAEAFGRLLEEKTGVPVEFFDERYTTVIASRRLHENDVSAKRQRPVIDAAAAAVLLEDYLRSKT